MDSLIQFNSLPIDGPLRITSRFGRRNTGIQGASTNHKGIDLGRDFSKSQTVVLSVAAGTVRKNYWNDVRGWVVLIQHNGYQTLYQHLKLQCPLPVGSKVKAGQPIGIMGASTKTIKGMAMHLHMELITNKGNQDPEPYLKNIVPEEKEMTKEEVKAIVREVLAESKAAPSSWAVKEWEQAKAAGIVDGTNPQAVPTREQVAAMVVRAVGK